MFCRNCGMKLNQGETFCSRCGMKIGEEMNTDDNMNQNNVTQQINDFNGTNQGQEFVQSNFNNQFQSGNNFNVGAGQNFASVNMMNQQIRPKKNNLVKISGIAILVFVVIIVLFVIIFFGVLGSSNKLVCTSEEGNITIMYNDSEITGYTAVGVKYDLDGQKEYAKQIGVDAYIAEFENWFVTNTSGSCDIKD